MKRKVQNTDHETNDGKRQNKIIYETNNYNERQKNMKEEINKLTNRRFL